MKTSHPTCWLSLLSAATVLVLVGCTSVTLPLTTSATDPANPDAEAAPLLPPSSTLAAKSESPALPREDVDAPSTHDHSKMHGSGGAEPESPADAAKSVAESYVCPMHPEIRSDKPGRCPKCGMALERKS